MDLDEQEVNKLAEKIDSENSESLAKLFIDLLNHEHTVRHQSKPRLIQKFTDAIDEEQGVV